jgi:hypothetical protein
LEGSGCGLIGILSWHSSGGAKKNHEKLQPKEPTGLTVITRAKS